jgi:hypothetical protein
VPEAKGQRQGPAPEATKLPGQRRELEPRAESQRELTSDLTKRPWTYLPGCCAQRSGGVHEEEEKDREAGTVPGYSPAPFGTKDRTAEAARSQPPCAVGECRQVSTRTGGNLRSFPFPVGFPEGRGGRSRLLPPRVEERRRARTEGKMPIASHCRTCGGSPKTWDLGHSPGTGKKPRFRSELRVNPGAFQVCQNQTRGESSFAGRFTSTSRSRPSESAPATMVRQGDWVEVVVCYSPEYTF